VFDLREKANNIVIPDWIRSFSEQTVKSPISEKHGDSGSGAGMTYSKLHNRTQVYMRTTIDIPDPLMKKAKIIAIGRGIILKEFLPQCLKKSYRKTGNLTPRFLETLQGKGSSSSLSPAD
jgi:hypothetical protein